MYACWNIRTCIRANVCRPACALLPDVVTSRRRAVAVDRIDDSVATVWQKKLPVEDVPRIVAVSDRIPAEDVLYCCVTIYFAHGLDDAMFFLVESDARTLREKRSRREK